jgi:hypothetical protein
MVLVVVTAVQDSDGKVLGTSSFEITDRETAKDALAEPLDQVARSTLDLLNLQSFTFKFDTSPSPH